MHPQIDKAGTKRLSVSKIGRLSCGGAVAQPRLPLASSLATAKTANALYLATIRRHCSPSSIPRNKRISLNTHPQERQPSLISFEIKMEIVTSNSATNINGKYT